MQHPNARLTPRQRLELILFIEGGASYREASACFHVAISTISCWVTRWRQAGDEGRDDLSCLHDRTSRPHRMPRRSTVVLEQKVARIRTRTGWGPRHIAREAGISHQAVWKILKRCGLSRKPRAPREVANRYEWPCPGDLLHMDTSRYARFDRPGHRMTGDRTKTSAEKRRGVGYDFCHAVVDDHSRLAYVELHADEKAETITAFTERALAFYASHGIAVKRLMTDNAWEYVKNRALRELLDTHGIRHMRTRPYRPQTNGKVERFHQTMRDEWAYGRAWNSESARRAALTRWLHHYNHHRPHTALGAKPPITRVTNVPGQNS